MEEGRQQRAKILIVDDSSTVRAQVSKTLSDADFEVLEARDGQDGFDTIAANSDLAGVICDMNMPGMNGLQMLAALKDSPHDASVLMLTTEGQPELIQQARAYGALGWMVKPFDPVLLVKAMQRLAARPKAGAGKDQ